MNTIAVTIVAAAAVLSASILIWKKLLYPLMQSIVLAGKALPILVEFTEAFKDRPGLFKTLAFIGSQFTTDGGSSLKDQINRLEEGLARQEAATERAEAAAEQIKTDKEVERRLTELSAARTQELSLLIDRVSEIAKGGAATGLRNEEAAKIVASDLAAAHIRADAVAGSGDAGAAADAAVLPSK